MKIKKFRFMKRDPEYKDCISYLCFTICHFHFNWFLDCGEWFIYITWETEKKVKGYRFSGAGNMRVSHIKK